MSHPLSGIWLLSTHITTETCYGVVHTVGAAHTVGVVSVVNTLGVVDTISVVHTVGVGVAHTVTFSVVVVYTWCCAHCRCHARTLSLCAQ